MVEVLQSIDVVPVTERVTVCLRPEVRLISTSQGHWEIRRGSQCIGFVVPDGVLDEMMSRLSDGGVPLQWFANDIGIDPLSPKVQIDRLARGGLLCLLLSGKDGYEIARFSSFEAIAFIPNMDQTSDGKELSEFAYARFSDSSISVQSLLSGSTLTFTDQRWFLATCVPGLAIDIPESDLAALNLLRSWLALLDGSDPERVRSLQKAMSMWEFPDVLIHNRSRKDLCTAGYGGTFVRAGLETLFREDHERGVYVPLPVPPDHDSMKTNSFFDVLASRKSIRRHSSVPISKFQLSEFLYWTFKERHRTSINGESISFRLYPAAGCLHEIGLYLIVQACDGLASGLYRYSAIKHGLEALAPLEARLRAIADGAARTCGFDGTPQIVLLLTADIERISRKYEAIAYSLILKDVGVLYGAMYLVATALGLAPCALGGGGLDDISKLSGCNPWIEARVGEFVLGNPAER